VEPQAIKVEMSEEIVQAQRRGRFLVVVLALITAVVGGAVGYVVGAGSANAAVDHRAVEGAASIRTSVKEAAGTAERIQTLMDTINTKLFKDFEFPEEPLKELSDAKVSFSAVDLENKGIDRFPKQTQLALFDFLARVNDVNSASERIVAILGPARARRSVQEFWEQRKDETRKVVWMATVQQTRRGPWVQLSPLGDKAFAVGDPSKTEPIWPETLEMKEGERTHKFERHKQMDLARTEGGYLPVDPDLQMRMGVCGDLPQLTLVASTIQALRDALLGSNLGTAEATLGLLELGKTLDDKLGEIGGE
jgi:hypothetical protein